MLRNSVVSPARHGLTTARTLTTQQHEKDGLFWRVRRGQRWGVFGLNGSGKTTLISLITSDHPQAYAQPVKLFGRSRLPEPGKPGISIFDLQSRIGHASPEIHAFFPRNLTLRRAIESAWADTFLTKPAIDADRRLDVSAALRFFEAELNPHFTPHTTATEEEAGGEGEEEGHDDWTTSVQFGTLPLPAQKLVLFLRAVVHKPDLVVLDEAFAGMSPALRDKCLHFLEVGEQTGLPSTGNLRTRDFAGIWHLPPRSGSGSERETRHTGLSGQQALVVTSHVREEVPDVVSHWMRLPSPAEEGQEGRAQNLGLRMGVLRGTETVAKDAWDKIWEVDIDETK